MASRFPTLSGRLPGDSSRPAGTLQPEPRGLLDHVDGLSYAFTAAATKTLEVAELARTGPAGNPTDDDQDSNARKDHAG